MTPDATLTCTRERAACNLLWYMTDRNQDERNQACFETVRSYIFPVESPGFCGLGAVECAIGVLANC